MNVSLVYRNYMFLGKYFYPFIFSIFVLCNSANCQNVFRFEYDLGASGSGFDSGEGGVSYKSSEGTFYVSGITDKGGVVDDPLLIKVNSAGAKVFVKQYMFTGNTSYEVVTHGRLTSDGGYLIYGMTDYTASSDILLIKTTAAGAVSWAKEIAITGVTSITTSRFFELASGGYLLTGLVNGVGAGSSDAFVISISSDGSTINFANAYGTSRAETSYSIIEHSSGKISFVGSTDVNATVVAQGWWVELSTTGTVNWSKSLGGTNARAETFQDLIETTANNYFVIGNFCSTGVTACSSFFAEFNSTTGVASNKNTFQTNPIGTLLKISCIYRTPDNSNYWIGGIIADGGGQDNCLMIKTSAATPSPSTGYSIGDADDQEFTLSCGAIPGNDEFIMGGTEVMGSEWRSLIIKAQSAIQCNSTTVNLTTSALGTAAANVATTVTALTLTVTDIAGAITATDRTAATTATQDCLTSLPVTLLSFSGETEANIVNLSWSTASEENNNYFTLEQSIDGKTFSEIGKVNGAGNSSMIRKYDFVDESPLSYGPGTEVYYRLSQTDFNGQYANLGIVAVKLSNEQTGLAMLVQSNPVITKSLSLNLFSPVDENVLLCITDLHGIAVYTESIFMKKKENTFVSINVRDLQQGIYFITATARNSSVNRKFIILNQE